MPRAVAQIIKVAGMQRVRRQDDCGDAPQKRIPADAEAALAASMPDGISQAARALQAKINSDRSAPKKVFDWRADEHGYADPDGI